MIRIDLQFFGGRGSSSESWGGGGGADPEVISTTSLISERERKQQEVDQVLSVFNDVMEEYGTLPYDVQIATMKNGGVLAYYDSADNLAINSSYFNSNKMAAAYEQTVKSGFHPSNGNKTAMEAVVAHEVGHTLTARAAGGFQNLDSVAETIVGNAAASKNYRSSASFAKTISGYAKTSAAEAVAEAFSDVYCNGGKAKSASKAIVDELNKYFKK